MYDYRYEFEDTRGGEVVGTAPKYISSVGNVLFYYFGGFNARFPSFYSLCTRCRPSREALHGLGRPAKCERIYDGDEV